MTNSFKIVPLRKPANAPKAIINALSNLILELLDDFQGRKLISSESKNKVLLYDKNYIFAQWENC